MLMVSLGGDTMRMSGLVWADAAGVAASGRQSPLPAAPAGRG